MQIAAPQQVIVIVPIDLQTGQPVGPGVPVVPQNPTGPIDYRQCCAVLMSLMFRHVKQYSRMTLTPAVPPSLRTPRPDRPHREHFRFVGDELPMALHGLRIDGDSTIDDQMVECSDGCYRPLREVPAMPSLLLVTRVYGPDDEPW